jgi:hypothetical protein
MNFHACAFNKLPPIHVKAVNGEPNLGSASQTDVGNVIRRGKILTVNLRRVICVDSEEEGL